MGPKACDSQGDEYKAAVDRVCAENQTRRRVRHRSRSCHVPRPALVSDRTPERPGPLGDHPSAAALQAALHLAETFNLPWSREGPRDANPSSAADKILSPGVVPPAPEPTEPSLRRLPPVCPSLDRGFWLRLWPCTTGRAGPSVNRRPYVRRPMPLVVTRERDRAVRYRPRAAGIRGVTPVGANPGRSPCRPTVLARHPEDGGGPRGDASERRDGDPGDDPAHRAGVRQSQDVDPEAVDMKVGRAADQEPEVDFCRDPGPGEPDNLRDQRGAAFHATSSARAARRATRGEGAQAEASRPSEAARK